MSTKKQTLPAEDRFKFIVDDELEAKIEGLKNKNTTKAEPKLKRSSEQISKRKA